MTTLMKSVKVGDAFLYRSHRSNDAQPATVVKITDKNRWITLALGNGEKVGPFKLDSRGYGEGRYEMYEHTSRHSNGEAVPVSLQARWEEERKERKAEVERKAAEDKKRSEDHAARIAAEMIVTKEAYNGDYNYARVYAEVLPLDREPWQRERIGEPKLFVFKAPVNPEHRKGKKADVEVIAVTVTAEKHPDFSRGEDAFKIVHKAEYKVVFPGSSSSSFEAATEEEAVWNCLNYRYHDSW